MGLVSVHFAALIRYATKPHLRIMLINSKFSLRHCITEMTKYLKAPQVN